MIKINYINLNERSDRKKNIEKLFNKSKLIKLNRFNAIKNENPRIGCYLSHIKILQDAKENKEKYVCIIEDDFYTDYINLFELKLDNILSSKESFDVLLFGGNILPNYKKINNNCAQIFHSQTTTGYYVASHYFDKLLNHFKSGMVLLMKNPNSFKYYSIDKLCPAVFTIPPSDVIVSPTVYAPALDDKNIAKPAMSSGVPTLFLGLAAAAAV